MGKFLKVLVIILFILSALALAGSVMLFMKRELLKGRTQRLEKAIKELDAVIEAEPGLMEPKPQDVEKDMSDCEAEIPQEIIYNDFWSTYKYNLEVQDPRSMLNTSARDRELRKYFAVDAAGNKRIKGPGTMDAVLSDLFKAAEAQYNLLNETRQQLSGLRKELLATIELYNQKKMDHRNALIKIKELEEEIERLKARVAELEERVAELEAQIQPLKDQIAEQERLIAEQEEAIGEKDREIERLNKILGEKSSPSDQGQTFGGQLEPGIKGEVMLVNQEWQFCIFKMSDAFFEEITGGEPDADIPQIDLWVKRPGEAEQIVTKIRMLQVKKEDKLATADILIEWKQLPMHEGDVVFY